MSPSHQTQDDDELNRIDGKLNMTHHTSYDQTQTSHWLMELLNHVSPIMYRQSGITYPSV